MLLYSVELMTLSEEVEEKLKEITRRKEEEIEEEKDFQVCCRQGHDILLKISKNMVQELSHKYVLVFGKS